MFHFFIILNLPFLDPLPFPQSSISIDGQINLDQTGHRRWLPERFHLLSLSNWQGYAHMLLYLEWPVSPLHSGAVRIFYENVSMFV